MTNSSHFPLLHWRLSLHRDTSKLSERGWCFTSKELGQPWEVPFYTQSYALPFYSTELPWMAPGDDSICCPAGHLPWGDPCTGSVETEPWLCCHFPDRYGLWGKEISMSTVWIPHTKCSSLCILYFTPTQFQTCWKQTREILFLFQSFFSGLSLSSPTSLWFCCFCTAGSWLDHDRETFNKPQKIYISFSPVTPGKAKASLLFFLWIYCPLVCWKIYYF